MEDVGGWEKQQGDQGQGCHSCPGGLGGGLGGGQRWASDIFWKQNPWDVVMDWIWGRRSGGSQVSSLSSGWTVEVSFPEMGKMNAADGGGSEAEEFCFELEIPKQVISGPGAQTLQLG